MKPYFESELITIYHGDCNEVLSTFSDESFRLIATDPPYGIKYLSNHRQQKFDIIEGDDKYPVDWLLQAKRICSSSGTIYIFCNDRSFDDARKALYQAKFQLQKTLVWDKMNVTAGNLENYGDRCEFILFGSRRYKPKLRGSRDGNLISIPRVYSHQLLHPTEKPVSLMSYLVMKSTDPGEITIDPFMGSGTTLLAAQQLGRPAVGIEVEEKYCEIAAHRIEKELTYLPGLN